jgi:hypothetical protein
MTTLHIVKKEIWKKKLKPCLLQKKFKPRKKSFFGLSGI